MGNHMKELYEYRRNLLERMLERARAFAVAVEAVADPKSPLEADGWNAHQIAVHVRDVEANAYGLRVHRMLAEENPEFQNFDGDEWMTTHYNPDESLAEILEDFLTDVKALTETLSEKPAEIWSRESRHAVYGSGFTLQTWVERGLAHIEEHLKTVSGE